MFFGLISFSINIRKNPKNSRFLIQNRQKSVKITKNEKKLGKNSMQKFPDLPFKTVTKLVQKRPKLRKNRPKISQFVIQNRQKIGSKIIQNETKSSKKFPNLSFKTVKKVGLKETKIEKII